MAWNGIHPVTGEEWKKRLHERSEETLKKFENALSELIEENNGLFKGHLCEILDRAELDDSYYGDLLNDLKIVKERIGVNAYGPNRLRRYSFSQ